MCGGGMHLLYLYDSESHDVHATTKEDQQIEKDLKVLVSQKQPPSSSGDMNGAAVVADAMEVKKAFPSTTFTKRFLRRTGEVSTLCCCYRLK